MNTKLNWKVAEIPYALCNNEKVHYVVHCDGVVNSRYLNFTDALHACETLNRCDATKGGLKK